MNSLAFSKFRDAKVELRRAAKPTSRGEPYFELASTTGSKTSVYRIWANELPWFVEALSQVAAGAPWGKPRPGMYVLAFEPAGTAAQALLMAAGEDGGLQLVIRRYQSTFTGASDAQARYTRYFVYDRRNQIWLPWSDKGLTELSAQAQESLNGLANQILANVSGNHAASFERPLAVFRRVIPNRSSPTGPKRALVVPGEDTAGSEFAILPSDADTLVLQASAEVSTPSEIALRLENLLGERSVRTLVEWSRRYSTDVLRSGYILNIHDAARVSSARSVELFATDPLLTSQFPKPTKRGKPNGRFASVPQCSERQLSAVVERGNCDGVLATVFGDVPLPNERKRAEMQALLAPAVGLRMNRWKLLQTMEMLSAALCNMPGGVSGSHILELQRLALLESDAIALFSDESGLVKPVIERARSRRQAALRSEREFHAYEALPKRE